MMVCILQIDNSMSSKHCLMGLWLLQKEAAAAEVRGNENVALDEERRQRLRQVLTRRDSVYNGCCCRFE